MLLELNLPCNELTSLPTEIGQLTSRLDVDGNQLWTLAEIGQLSSLRRLNAGGNYRMVEEINA